MAKYKLSKAAKADIQNIWDYTIDKWSYDQAETYVFGLIDVLCELDRHTVLTKDRSDVRQGYKRLTYQKHHIYYKIDEDGAYEIIRILHQQMDVLSHIE